MKAQLRITAGMAIAVVLMTGAWAAGQSQKDPKTGKNGGNPPAASQADTSSGNGQKGKSGSMQNVKSNPLYKDNTNQGSNPMYEGRDSADKGSTRAQSATPEETRYRPGNNKTTDTAPTGGAATVEYKDPEDMTTRYRPGNNKTTKIQPAAANKNHETVEYKDPEDQTTRSKAPEGKTQKPN